MVAEAKEHIAAGDIFQVVLSQRFSRQTSAHPFAIYRALRMLNPSPYMFYFDFAPIDMQVIGASPEMHVRLEDGVASVRPIAGTRRRGQTPAEDQALADELLADPKERAEHVMLIDLGRNDIGRVSEYGSVERARFDGRRAIQPRHAHRQPRRRADQARPGRVRPDAGDLPGGHSQRCAQGAGDGDYRGAGRPAARFVRGRGRATSATTAAWTPVSPSAPC